MKNLLAVPLIIHAVVFASSEFSFKDLNLPANHLRFVLSHHKHIAEKCRNDTDCPHEESDISNSCWGYEVNCDREKSFASGKPKHCTSKYNEDDFWTRADFGFVANIIKEMKDLEICSPSHPADSSLVCSRNMRYCKARNLYLDLRNHNPIGIKDRFKEDMFQKGEIGGRCKLNKILLDAQGEHAYPLQSWFSELQNFTNLSFRPVRHKSNCDIVITTPTVFMKLDSGINLYHHFCDFFNLYLSQHVNNSWFGTDNQIVMWDTSHLGYFDIFEEAWKAFTDRPMIHLEHWAGKRICLSDVMFPLLPRMRSGLYYNSYIPAGCVGSSLFRAFSEHFLHRMGVSRKLPTKENSVFDPKIKITLLERGKAEETNVYRKIKNQEELLKVLNRFPDVHVQVVRYKYREITLKEQLEITHNSDIFVGMHGAGLLHFLFLPDWAVAFELYNCGDERCYHDLARLRGLDYITWQKGKVTASDKGKHARYGDNPKFWNWSFDVKKFSKLISRAIELVKNNPKYTAEQKHFPKSKQSKDEF